MVITLLSLQVLLILISMGTSYGRVKHRCREPKLEDNCVSNSPIHESFLMMEQEYVPRNDINAFVNIRRKALTSHDGVEQCTWQNGNSVNSTCPHHYVINYDPNRRPKRLLEAECNCNKNMPCLNGDRESRCVPIQYYIEVLRKTGCDGRHFIYTRTVEPITVGCTCAYPLSITLEKTGIRYINEE